MRNTRTEALIKASPVKTQGKLFRFGREIFSSEITSPPQGEKKMKTQNKQLQNAVSPIKRKLVRNVIVKDLRWKLYDSALRSFNFLDKYDIPYNDPLAKHCERLAAVVQDFADNLR